MNEAMMPNPVGSVIEPLLILGLILSVIFVFRVLYVKIMMSREYSRIARESIAMSANNIGHSYAIPKFQIAISAMNRKELLELIADKNQNKKIIEEAKNQLLLRRV